MFSLGRPSDEFGILRKGGFWGRACARDSPFGASVTHENIQKKRNHFNIGKTKQWIKENENKKRAMTTMIIILRIMIVYEHLSLLSLYLQ